MEERLMRGTSTFRTKSPSANSTVLCRTVMVAWTSFIIMPQHRKAKKSCVTWLSNIWTPPPRRPSLSRFALPPDKVMQAGSGDAGGLAELHRLDFTGRDQLVELGAADADHAGSVVDANADRIRGSSRLHGAALSLSSAR